MNHAHRRFLELAATSVDFDLTAAERAELANHLATCPACAQALDALRADARLLRSLPTRAIALERAPVILGPAIGLRPRRGALRLIAIAAVLSLLLVGLLVAGSELLRKQTVTPTQSPAPATSAPTPPLSTVWASADALSVPRTRFTAVVMGDGRVLVVGGDGGAGVIEMYDPATGQWGTTVDSAMADRFNSRWQATGIRLADGGAFVVGGFGTTNAGAWTDVFPQGRSWEPGPTLLQPRGAASVVQLVDGTVLVVGGSGNGFLDSAELLSLASGENAFTGSLAEGRHSAQASLLRDGRVLVTGGNVNEDSITNTAEIYDATTGDWSPAAPMRDPRSRHTSTLLTDGRVLIVGGNEYNVTTPAEIYDPATDTWAAAGRTDWRAGHGAALLPDGRVLVVGGFQIYDSMALATTELFDPAANTWSAGPDLLNARSDVVLVTLLDGSIMVIGRFAGDAATGEVEILRVGGQGS